jgi:glucose-1-phosphate cytidylyltransferase
MKVVILCGGQGTRIRGIAADLPKPMIEIGRYPILWHIMKGYAKWGCNDFVLCLGYQSAVIKDFFVNYQVRTSDVTITLGRNGRLEFTVPREDESWRVTLAETGLNALTGARVKRIRQYLANDEDFMLTYGDGVSDVDVPALIDFHRRHGRIMTVTGVRPPGRFGELELDGVRVSGFNEKPQATAGRISGGFFVCSSKMFEYLDDREDLMLELEPMKRLAADGELMMYEHDGFWHPMDTPRDHRLLNDLWESGNAPWKTW